MTSNVRSPKDPYAQLYSVLLVFFDGPLCGLRWRQMVRDGWRPCLPSMRQYYPDNDYEKSLQNTSLFDTHML